MTDGLSSPCKRCGSTSCSLTVDDPELPSTVRARCSDCGLTTTIRQRLVPVWPLRYGTRRGLLAGFPKPLNSVQRLRLVRLALLTNRTRRNPVDWAALFTVVVRGRTHTLEFLSE